MLAPTGMPGRTLDLDDARDKILNRRQIAPHELPDPGYAVAKEPRHVQHCRKPRGRPSRPRQCFE